MSGISLVLNLCSTLIFPHYIKAVDACSGEGWECEPVPHLSGWIVSQGQLAFDGKSCAGKSIGSPIDWRRQDYGLHA